ncbi:hypothetical protein [Sphaerothrix gracilis]|uniref:hypothetical protein n=1 Tax=Sphaerothrix gracilis TaxID=3151835 RepID=UPI0031FD6276
MERKLTDLSFEDWILFVFCWPEDPNGLLWYYDHDCEYWDAPPAQIITYLTRLFEQPAAALTGYTDGEIAQGLWYIVSNGASDYMFALADITVPLCDRLRCLDAFEILFRELFAARCSPHLSHRDEPGANPLNVTCYMWWDLLPLCPVVEEREAIFEAVWRSQTAMLHLPAIACQEAALHGMGHWLETNESAIQATIDTWLRQQPHIRPELRAYAQSARCGCVL